MGRFYILSITLSRLVVVCILTVQRIRPSLRAIDTITSQLSLSSQFRIAISSVDSARTPRLASQCFPISKSVNRRTAIGLTISNPAPTRGPPSVNGIYSHGLDTTTDAGPWCSAERQRRERAAPPRLQSNGPATPHFLQPCRVGSRCGLDWRVGRSVQIGWS